MSDATARNAFFIHLLGDVGIEPPGGGSGPSLPRKAWAILSFLAAESGTSQPRDRLAGIFWPDLDEKAARNNLRQVLLILQRTLKDPAAGPPCIIADRQTIGLGADCRHRIDLVEFGDGTVECAVNEDPARCSSCIASIEALAALYRGEFIAGFHLDDCPEFEEWLQVHREALHRRALVLLERLAQCHEKLGNIDRALTFARRYTELEPWNEEGQRRYIRLLAVNGQRGAALSQYEACRRVLRDELGVQPEEETRTLAAKIQKGAVQPPSVAERDAIAVQPLPSANWERRQVTVLYCQLSPSSAEDPDEILDLLRGPQAACAETIRRFSGHVVRTNDGGLLAYFGFPSALEHAARLAVQAGLALTGETFAGLEMRIGIHTGLIITGGDPNLPDTIGRTSALAVRLRTLAATNDLVVSAATQRIVAGYFKWVAAEGGADRPDAFRVLGESGAVTRLGAAAALTPLTGRDAEITALSERWHEARRGRFQARLLTGDPGIGKSRLVLALKQEVARAPGAIRELQCLPEFSQSPFQPLIRMLEDLSGISAEDDPETRFSRLAGYLESQHGATDLHEVIPLFATMMSLPIAAPYRPPTTPLRTQRERIMSAIADQLRGVAAKTPVLLVVEDLHWCDPTTLELLSRIVLDTAPQRVLVLCTARPEFVPPWPESAMLQSRLPPLSDDDVGALIDALELDVPADAARNIVANADGVPLFAEELARALPPTGYDRSVGVPMTLQDLLAARLDVLEDAKSTAQLAAAVGREFSLAVLRDVSPLDEKELVAAIARLRDAGLLSPTGEDGFKFRHALFQDAAYRSQARDDRMAAHRGIAETLQARFPDVARDHPEILARHWGEAGEAETAIGFWVRAGRRANLHCANKEAIARFNAGLKLAEALPEGQRRIQLQFDLQVGLGAAHFAAEGYASSDGADAYAQAVELGERHTGNPDLFNAHWGLWACTSSRADYDESLGMTLGLLRMGARSGDPVKEQQGHFAVGNIRFWRGEFAEARDHLEHAMTLYRPEHHERLVTDFGENAYVTSGAYLSWTLGILGFAEQAEKTARRALDEARRIDHPFSLGYTLTFVTVLQRMLRRPAETLTYAEETIALAEEHDFPLWKAGATLKQGWAMVRQGDGKGIERMRESVESVASLMSGITLIFLETLADSLLDIGAHEDALATIAEGWDFVTELGDHHVEAELHRLKGECLLRCSAFDPSGAEICFHRALTVARRQQAKLLELRAARSMARLWQEQDRSDDARALLADVYDRFTEGFDTPDLRDTRALLDSLGAK